MTPARASLPYEKYLRKPRRKKPRLRKAAIVFALTLICATIVWHTDVVRQAAGDFLICSQNPGKADLTVVLGGDYWGARTDRAAALGAMGYAPQVLISGPIHPGKGPEAEAAIQRLATLGCPRDLFVGFDHQALSTPREVQALCPELRRRTVNKMILVTDRYHSRRAVLTLVLLCPGIEVISAPPADDVYYDAKQWWTRPRDRDVFKSEWTRIIGTVILSPWYWLGL